MATLLVLIIATLDIFFGREKLLDEKGLLSDNVIKNPARYIVHAIREGVIATETTQTGICFEFRTERKAA